MIRYLRTWADQQSKRRPQQNPILRVKECLKRQNHYSPMKWAANQGEELAHECRLRASTRRRKSRPATRRCGPTPSMRRRTWRTASRPAGGKCTCCRWSRSTYCLSTRKRGRHSASRSNSTPLARPSYSLAGQPVGPELTNSSAVQAAVRRRPNWQ